MSFQYQAGPRSSYRLISCRVKGTVLPNGSGSLSIGVDDESGAVRSITSTVALRIASARALSTDMRAPVPVPGHGPDGGWIGNAGPAVLSPAASQGHQMIVPGARRVTGWRRRGSPCCR